MAQRIGIRLCRYLVNDDGVECEPAVSGDCDEKDVLKAVKTFLVQLNAVPVPPADVVGTPLQPMTTAEVQDYRERMAQDIQQPTPQPQG